MRNKDNQGGFVLLISSIIIASILTAVIFAVSFRGFFTRFNLLDSENKERSLALAEACANLAILKRFQDNTYAGNETLAVGSESCKVRPVLTPGDIIIETTASVSGSFSNIRVDLDPTTLTINRWREIKSF
ncbi:MAG: hypothetical protein Q8R55_05975 [Candidatus Taylorbacteria bacterium]|nr:hypothetical protein [Candidatus Taylorbacteria bacterium]